MKLIDTSDAEAHVLDRMMHLLEEHSVYHLASKNEDFADFVGKMYQTIERQADSIRGK